MSPPPLSLSTFSTPPGASRTFSATFIQGLPCPGNNVASVDGGNAGRDHAQVARIPCPQAHPRPIVPLRVDLRDHQADARDAPQAHPQAVDLRDLKQHRVVYWQLIHDHWGLAQLTFDDLKFLPRLWDLRLMLQDQWLWHHQDLLDVVLVPAVSRLPPQSVSLHQRGHNTHGISHLQRWNPVSLTTALHQIQGPAALGTQHQHKQQSAKRLTERQLTSSVSSFEPLAKQTGRAYLSGYNEHAESSWWAIHKEHRQFSRCEHRLVVLPASVIDGSRSALHSVMLTGQNRIQRTLSLCFCGCSGPS